MHSSLSRRLDLSKNMNVFIVFSVCFITITRLAYAALRTPVEIKIAIPEDLEPGDSYEADLMQVVDGEVRVG